MPPRDTVEALAQITDEGLFEQIATAVLRLAEPVCATFAHPGVNAKGKTRKSPVDNVSFVPGASPPHLLAAHHTTTAGARLREKWLHDPAAVRPRNPGGRPTAPPGDVIKTADIIARERARTPDLVATLYLTTNEEPSVELIGELQVTAAASGIIVDVWSRSRIAHVLDYTPGGQAIRRKLLGIEQDMLSENLLQKLSCASLAAFHPPDRAAAWVERELDARLRNAPRPIAFPIAPSGHGKSVAAFRALSAHINSGGAGLVMSHDVLAAAVTLERAVMDALRQLHPTLDARETVLDFCTAERPFFLVIEDISRSGRALQLLEKLIFWFSDINTMSPWRVLCPLWPDIIGGLRDETRRRLEPMLVHAGPFNEEEGKTAVRVRAHLAGRTVSDVDALVISKGLGADPLLIALYDFGTTPDPQTVVGLYVEGALARVSCACGRPASELHAAMLWLAGELLLRLAFDPTWLEVLSWAPKDYIREALQAIAARDEALRLVGPSTDQRLQFRHDRVREWALIAAAQQLQAEGDLPPEVLGEPAFADVMGACLVAMHAPDSLIERIAKTNPLALFQALRVRSAAADVKSRIAKRARIWIEAEAHRTPRYSSLRWQALVALSEGDGDFIPDLVAAFPENWVPGQLARLRNGDISGGIDLCARADLGLSSASYRDRPIAHAKLRQGAALINALSDALTSDAFIRPALTALLYFVGYVGHPALADQVLALWFRDDGRTGRLEAYLWALARCCTIDNASRLLEPICDAWAALPEAEGNGFARSDHRSGLAAYGARFAFETHLPEGAFNYFVTRAAQPELTWPITYMLHAVDHPVAVCFIAEHLAASRRRAGWSPFESTVTYAWERSQEQGSPMSTTSRAALRALWQDADVDQALRRAAFNIWAATEAADDVGILQAAAAKAHPLEDRLLQARLVRGDRTAIQGFLKKLENPKNYWWWQYARHHWVPELLPALDMWLVRCGEQLKRVDGADSNPVYIVSEMLMRVPMSDAEHLLLKHWAALKTSRWFFQSAMFVASPELLRRSATAVARAEDPKVMFLHIASRFGISTVGHPGITSERQILALEPYLDLLEEHDLRQLAEACNQAGWFDLRRRLFDVRIQDRHCCWTPDLADQEWDSLVESDRPFWIDHEIDLALKTGVEWAQVVEHLSNWLDRRRTLAALRLVAAAIAYRGTRADLVRLVAYEEMDLEAADALIQDTTFIVRRRVVA